MAIGLPKDAKYRAGDVFPKCPERKRKRCLSASTKQRGRMMHRPLIGGFPAGQIAYPVAVVLLESGNVVTVNAECVTIDSPAELFEQYAWMDGEDE